MKNKVLCTTVIVRALFIRSRGLPHLPHEMADPTKSEKQLLGGGGRTMFVINAYECRNVRVRLRSSI